MSGVRIPPGAQGVFRAFQDNFGTTATESLVAIASGDPVALRSATDGCAKLLKALDLLAEAGEAETARSGA